MMRVLFANTPFDVCAKIDVVESERGEVRAVVHNALKRNGAGGYEIFIEVKGQHHFELMNDRIKAEIKAADKKYRVPTGNRGVTL